MPTVEQWRTMWAGLGAPAPEGLFERLLGCYAEPHRRYHTPQHLDECFAALSAMRWAATHPEEILQGFLRRRSIYATLHFRAARETLARDNLRLSVDLLRTGLRGSELLLLAAIGAWTLAGLVLRIPMWIVVLVALAAAVAYAWAAERSGSRSRSGVRGAPAASPYAVQCSGDGIAVSLGGVPRESVRWDDIVTVGIRIDEGFLPQPWWIVGGSRGGCTFPSDADGWQAALAELQRRLPGFDNEAVIRAAGMMSGGIVVWEKSAQR